MAFREISPGYSDAVYTIDPRIITNTNTPPPPDAYTFTDEKEQQKSAQDEDTQYLDFFTVTPSMDAIQETFCAQSALWLDSPPTIPSNSQFHGWLASAGVLPNPYTPSMGAEASTSQLSQWSPVPLALPQGTSGTTCPLTASPEPSSGWQELSHQYQELSQLISPQLTDQDATPLPRRDAGRPLIRHDSSLRKDSLLLPPPSVRRSARPKARVNYNYDPQNEHRAYHKHATILDDSAKITKGKNKQLRDVLYTPPDGQRVLFVCEEGECSNPGRKAMTFTRKADLTRHRRSVHDEIKRFRCRGCDKAFPRHDALTRHERTCRKLQDEAEGSVVE